MSKSALTYFIPLLVLLLSIGLATAIKPANAWSESNQGFHHATKRLDAVPFTLQINNQNGVVTLNKNEIEITALKGTDLFTNTTGDKSADNSPRVLFTPKGDFILSAKVTANLDTAYSGGALIVYVDNKRWAKLLFERFKSGDNGVATTITNNTGDDAYHGTLHGQTQYLKIARHGSSYVFYSSNDGEKWHFLRHFNLSIDKPVHIGFTAQSPLSEELTANFSDISYEARRFEDFWQGK